MNLKEDYAALGLKPREYLFLFWQETYCPSEILEALDDLASPETLLAAVRKNLEDKPGISQKRLEFYLHNLEAQRPFLEGGLLAELGQKFVGHHERAQALCKILTRILRGEYAREAFPEASEEEILPSLSDPCKFVLQSLMNR